MKMDEYHRDNKTGEDSSMNGDPIKAAETPRALASLTGVIACAVMATPAVASAADIKTASPTVAYGTVEIDGLKIAYRVRQAGNSSATRRAKLIANVRRSDEKAWERVSSRRS
ncbi:hypothetical protein [Rhizobium bangladeshense]|uniref:hypothetical protein n=1 Tax=Rhizobium bangladeshense TaxID=1138189 RepID=UPI0028C4B75A|nr:hypothetical protein [Rhizobium bangladeshense]